MAVATRCVDFPSVRHRGLPIVGCRHVERDSRRPGRRRARFEQVPLAPQRPAAHHAPHRCDRAGRSNLDRERGLGWRRSVGSRRKRAPGPHDGSFRQHHVIVHPQRRTADQRRLLSPADRKVVPLVRPTRRVDCRETTELRTPITRVTEEITSEPEDGGAPVDRARQQILARTQEVPGTWYHSPCQFMSARRVLLVRHTG